MENLERMGVQDVRKHLRKVIDGALIRGAATVVERHGEPVAAVVPYEWFRRAQAALASEERENISARP